jgi:hypothetical protein
MNSLLSHIIYVRLRIRIKIRMPLLHRPYYKASQRFKINRSFKKTLASIINND